jgi:starvation-inducible DNA-binding protein
MSTASKEMRGKQTLVREVSANNAADNPVVQHLRRQVGNALLLYLNYKHYHWQTYGPLFRDLHKLFDRLADEVLESVDPLAERLRMIGQDPPASPNEIADAASAAVAAPHASMREMLEEANRNQLVVIREMRDGARAADDHDDPGTVDLFSRLVQVHEKHEWWTRDILRAKDGLTS